MTPLAPGAATVELVDSTPAVAEVRAGWEALARDALEPNPFYEPFALLPAMTHLRRRTGVSVLLVYTGATPGDRRQLIGLFPLQRRNRYRWMPVPTLTTWTHRFCFLGTPLVHRAHADRCLAAVLRWFDSGPHRRGLLAFTTLAWDGPFAAALRDALDRSDRVAGVVTTTHQRALLERGTDADTFIRHALRKKRRHDYARLQRRLAERGHLSCRSLGPEEDPGSWIEEFLNLEQRGWKGRRGGALVTREGGRPFFQEMATDAQRQGRLTMLSLELDGRPVAMKCNLTSGHAAYAFKTAYDESFARFSPGVLLELENLRHVHRHPRLRWMDSCANPNHPMIDRLWPGRRSIATVVLTGRLAPGPAIGRLLRWSGGSRLAST